jgi:POT family proton-dependent oligopeptide transporter
MGAILPLLSAYISAHPGVVAGVVGVSLGLFLWLVWALRGHPVGFWFIFWGELAERSSYYGMRTVLALYMTTVLGFEQGYGAKVMSFFMAACYLTPLFGGILADRVLGRYKTILYFSGPYILGHIILGGWENTTGLYVALALLAIGAGSIKPNISTLMGDMYEKQGKPELINKAFSYYYAAINVGSFISTFSLPKIRDAIIETDTAKGIAHDAAVSHGYSIALMIPAVLMAIAFFAFALGKPHYPVEVIAKNVVKTPEQKAAERDTLLRISGILGVIAVFWFVYDQSASTWVYFAQNNMDMTVWGDWKTTPDQIQALNPFLIIFFTPLFNVMWDFLKARRGGVDVPDTRKMMAGFIIVLVCMAIMSFAGFLAGGQKISVWWLAIATFVITISELCVSVVGLEFAFKQALPGTKSAVTGAFWLTVFIGDFIAGYFDDYFWDKDHPGVFFAIQTAIMFVGMVAFFFIARKFENAPAPAARAAAA